MELIKLITAKGVELSIDWIGISDFDGSLRFEVLSDDMNLLYGIFTDPEQTGTLTRVYDEEQKVYEGFTAFKGIEKMASNNIVVRLMRG